VSLEKIFGILGQFDTIYGKADSKGRMNLFNPGISGCPCQMHGAKKA
jgi:hypothetical protein